MRLKSFLSFSLSLWATNSWTILCIKFKNRFVPIQLCEEAAEAPPLCASVWNDSVIAGLLVVAPHRAEMSAWLHQCWPLDPTSRFVFFSPPLCSFFVSIPVNVGLSPNCPSLSHALESICKDTFLFWSKRPSREADACWFVPGLLMCTGTAASLLSPLKL